MYIYLCRYRKSSYEIS